MSSRSYQMPGGRHRRDPWFTIGSLDVSTTVLITGLCGFALVLGALAPGALDPLVMWPSSVRGGEVWRLLLWPLVNGISLFSVIQIAIYWMFGREVEARVGRSEYVVMTALLVIVPAIVALVLDVPLSSISLVEVALFFLFVLEHPNAPFFFGIPAWIVGAALIGINILGAIANRDFPILIVLVTSLAVAALTARFFGMLGRYEFIPDLSKVTKPRPKSGTSGTVTKGPWDPRPNALSRDEQRELDGLLDKISAHGADSLEPSERRRLTDLSEKLRNK